MDSATSTRNGLCGCFWSLGPEGMAGNGVFVIDVTVLLMGSRVRLYFRMMFMPMIECEGRSLATTKGAWQSLSFRKNFMS